VQGLHLTADLHHCQCDAAWLTDAARLVAWCEHAVEQAGLQPVAQLAHTFPSVNGQASGVTATVLLAESHLCVHTWPEQRAVTLDVYVCNFGGDHTARAQGLLQALIALFAPGHVERHVLQRGAVAALQASAS
jgi:S-adenosylmethionine decarboxylase